MAFNIFVDVTRSAYIPIHSAYLEIALAVAQHPEHELQAEGKGRRVGIVEFLALLLFLG
jgi:hypothetical protein